MRRPQTAFAIWKTKLRYRYFLPTRVPALLPAWLIRFLPGPLKGTKVSKTVSSANVETVGALRVPYGPAAASLSMEGFVLGVDAGPAHDAEVSRIADVMRTVAVTAHPQALECIDREILTAPRNVSFNVEPILREAVLAWSASMLGVRDVCPGLRAAADAVLARTYVHGEFFAAAKPEIRAEAIETVREFQNTAVTTTARPEAGSVLHELRAGGVDLAGQRRDVTGLVGGPAALTTLAAIAILQWAVVSERRWRSISAQVVNGVLPVEFVSRLVAAAPPQALLPRLDASGRKVLVRTWKRQPMAKPGAPEFDGFGVEPHRCLGHGLALDALQHLLSPLFDRSIGVLDPPSREDLRHGLWLRITTV